MEYNIGHMQRTKTVPRASLVVMNVWRRLNDLMSLKAAEADNCDKRKRKFLNKFCVIHNALCRVFVVIAKTELESC